MIQRCVVFLGHMLGHSRLRKKTLLMSLTNACRRVASADGQIVNHLKLLAIHCTA